NLEERVKHRPDVAEQRIRALFLQVGLDQVADQVPPGQDVLDALTDQPERVGLGGTRPERGGRLGAHVHGRPYPSTMTPHPASFGKSADDGTGPDIMGRPQPILRSWRNAP